MNPAVTIVNPTIVSPYLYPDNLQLSETEDYELGGIGLSDPSQGLEVQAWKMEVLGTGAGTYISVSAPNTPPTTLLSVPDISWARLTFDQNMHPVIAYIASGLPYLYWWDPTVPGNVSTPLPTTITAPCVTLDDKRPLATLLGQSDVVLCYINNNNLCYRLQRDRYGTEYVWVNNIDNIIASARVFNIGMTVGMRLLVYVQGSLYL